MNQCGTQVVRNGSRRRTRDLVGSLTLLPFLVSLSACSNGPQDGQTVCRTAGDCPAGWVCQASRCWSHSPDAASSPGDDAGPLGGDAGPLAEVDAQLPPGTDSGPVGADSGPATDAPVDPCADSLLHSTWMSNVWLLDEPAVLCTELISHLSPDDGTARFYVGGLPGDICRLGMNLTLLERFSQVRAGGELAWTVDHSSVPTAPNMSSSWWVVAYDTCYASYDAPTDVVTVHCIRPTDGFVCDLPYHRGP